MTIGELKAIINAIPEEDLDYPVILDYDPYPVEVPANEVRVVEGKTYIRNAYPPYDQPLSYIDKDGIDRDCMTRALVIMAYPEECKT